MTRDPRVKKSCNADEADLRRQMRWESHRLGGVQGCGAHATARSWHRMKFSEVLVLLAAGTLGGIFSTVVSIASLVSYPVLHISGLSDLVRPHPASLNVRPVGRGNGGTPAGGAGPNGTYLGRDFRGA